MKEISVIKEDERKKISLMYDTESNKRYILRRIHDDKREIYKALQKIIHPSIPKIISVEFDCDTVVLEEYIDGKSLSRLMDENTVFTKKQIRSIAKQLVSAMSELHKSNIIHRDIKPDNIIISESGNVWLIDYDIARIYRDEVRKDTETMGTFGYAPIEQYGMLPTDYRTDIYAFGATLIRLLDYSGIKGPLYRIAEKCKRLDPAQRYDISSLKRSLNRQRFMPILLLFCAAALISGVVLAAFSLSSRPNTADTSVSEDKSEYVEIDGKMVKVDDKLMSLLCFTDFKLSDHYEEYMGYANFSSTFIFNYEDILMRLSFMEDMKNSGSILMGKNNRTPISSEIELRDGVLSLSLRDPYGNSFEKDFAYTPDHPFRPLYTKNRRVNAEMVCWDMDGDNNNELLIGLCDCSFSVENRQIFMYFNYSQAWCLRYDESRGFVLCDGDMFSENSKFTFLKNDLRVHLPAWAVTDDRKSGYQLKGDNIIPFY